MSAYYNENDPYAAEWLRNLIAEGLIAPGDVDDRSIEDVRPTDVVGYAQCHWFAGIGGWSYALRLAGWPDERPVWTGSCPCQPFSAAGARKGFDDERHLWPDWYWLIRQCRPRAIFGEQVASADGRTWLDAVCADLELAAYAVGAVDLPAAGVGAPHIRQRLWFVAHTGRDGGQSERQQLGAAETGAPDQAREQRLRADVGDGGADGELGEPIRSGLEGHARAEASQRKADGFQSASRPIATAGIWSDCDWLPCRDGKARSVEPGTFPLAHGATARVGRLRAFGNAIVPQVAAQVIRAAM